MERVLAKRPGQVLVKTSKDKGYIFDRRGASASLALSSALARGYWEPATTMSMAQAREWVNRDRARS